MKFGIREICDVTFKAAADNQKVGTAEFKKYQPVFTIDTAQTSEMSQESTTVYAQGGRGYNRLIAWEGEKTMTFTVTDALISPMGLAVLSGAGLIDLDGAQKGKNVVHVHVTSDVAVTAGVGTIDFDTIAEEIGVPSTATINLCSTTETPVYGTLVDGSGYGYKWYNLVDMAAADSEGTAIEAEKALIPVKDGDKVTFTVQKMVKDEKDPEKETAETDTDVNGTVRFDYYVVMTEGATQIEIKPGDFGGYFYVEADTLFRREDNGQDMAATLTFPRVKVQSGFTFTMAATGDPSTFDFTMDAFPGYTQFDKTKKVCVTMAIVGSDAQGAGEGGSHPSHLD